jgi:hypothetical protein
VKYFEPIQRAELYTLKALLLLTKIAHDPVFFLSIGTLNEREGDLKM